MSSIKDKFLETIKNSEFIKRNNYDKFIFYFLFNLKSQFVEFKININTKCLVLSQYPGAETKGLGGLIAQYPKNFEILCLTNGSNMIEELDPIESANIKKQQFQDVMKFIRAKGYKIFDIDSLTLKNHYSTFKKIDISEADYIFIPNVYDNSVDTIALLKHFKQILCEKEYKQSLKIIMYESDFPLCMFDYYVNTSSIIETKKNMLKVYYPVEKYPLIIDKLIGINSFRGIKLNQDYCETFMSFSIDEFFNIPLI